MKSNRKLVLLIVVVFVPMSILCISIALSFLIEP